MDAAAQAAVVAVRQRPVAGVRGPTGRRAALNCRAPGCAARRMPAGEQEAHVLALAGGAPPEGHDR